MKIDVERIAILCAQNAYYLREDLTLIESGHLKLELFGADVTAQQAGRLRRNLARLQDVIEGCGSNFEERLTSPDVVKSAGATATSATRDGSPERAAR